jgi:hypothetical protein
VPLQTSASLERLGSERFLDLLCGHTVDRAFSKSLHGAASLPGAPILIQYPTVAQNQIFKSSSLTALGVITPLSVMIPLMSSGG